MSATAMTAQEAAETISRLDKDGNSQLQAIEITGESLRFRRGTKPFTGVINAEEILVGKYMYAITPEMRMHRDSGLCGRTRVP